MAKAIAVAAEVESSPNRVHRLSSRTMACRSPKPHLDSQIDHGLEFRTGGRFALHGAVFKLKIGLALHRAAVATGSTHLVFDQLSAIHLVHHLEAVLPVVAGAHDAHVVGPLDVAGTTEAGEDLRNPGTP
jgi:hypothetical protein